MVKSTFLLLLAIVFTLPSAHAQNVLCINKKDGGAIQFEFREKPVVTFIEDDLHVNTSSVSINYPFSDIASFTFEHAENDIEAIYTTGESTEVRIYKIDGTLVHVTKNTDDMSIVKINDLPNGIYIVKNGKLTYKIVKK